MKMLENVQKAIYEIKHLIKESTEIRKLLIHDTVNALELSKPSYEDVEEYVVVSPIFDATEPPFDKNTIVTVAIKKGKYDDETILLHSFVHISILTRSTLWKLNNNKIRPLEIADLIIKAINHKKLTTSHKILFSHFELSVLNEDVNGYTLTFLMEEGSGLDEKF